MKPWTFDDVPDQTGRTALVTGANTGIGLETARMLAVRGANVVLACRNPEKGQAALERIRTEKPNGSVSLEILDLADLESVSAFGGRFLAGHTRLDLLIDNAGLMIPPLGRTKQGFELQFGTNYLGHFALTALLLPIVLQTPHARVVIVGSTAANFFGSIDLDDLNWERKPYKPWAAYGQSKLAEMMFGLELQRRLTAVGSDVRVTGAHPGATATELQRHQKMPNFLNWLKPMLEGRMGMMPPQGALPTMRAATDPEAGDGSYWGPANFFELNGPPVPAKMPDKARDAAVAARLWEVSEKLTGVTLRIPARPEAPVPRSEVPRGSGEARP